MTAILPGATLGVMGGGQLGRMFVHAAQRMGYFTAVLDPDPASPAGLVSHYHIQTNYLDQQGLAQLMQRSAAITTEFENVPAPALVTLGAHRPVAPGAEAVAIAQDRAQEKAHFARCGVPCAPYTPIETPEHLAAAKAELLPGVLKTSRLGYDGKGQVQVRKRDELQGAWDDLKRVPCVLEKLLPLAAEFSVIVARGHDGQMVHLPPQLNRHRGGILAVTEVYPQSVPAPQARHAVTAAKAVAEELGYVGVLCIEFFVLADGSLVVNEMAPRPHNSGHYSMDACDVSQFELQVRALAGLPLPQPRQHSPAIMLNLMGELWLAGGESERTPPWDQLLALAGTHLHLYGKLSPRKGRKMGHVTITHPTVEAVRATAMKAADLLGIEPF
ncbi:MAG TPA: 5-(carboxyamino)imidazole ribonucleotide synthase [Ramlibacter sp.]|jgi:5-(carboxyamino)imidazole ribonucleotide synthase